MRRIRIVKGKPTKRRDTDSPDLRTPSGRLLPF
jgi:hypothetical protein